MQALINWFIMTAGVMFCIALMFAAFIVCVSFVFWQIPDFTLSSGALTVSRIVFVVIGIVVAVVQADEKSTGRYK